MATLTSSITAIADRLSITDPGSPRPGARYEIEDELVELVRLAKTRPGVDNDPTVWYVNRGVEGTVATSHDAGATVTEFLVTTAEGGGLPTGWEQDVANPANVITNGGNLDVSGTLESRGDVNLNYPDNDLDAIAVRLRVDDLEILYPTDQTFLDATLTRGLMAWPNGDAAITLLTGQPLLIESSDGVTFSAGDVSVNSYNVKNLADPVDVDDAAKKAYVDTAVDFYSGIIVAAGVPSGAPAVGKLPIAYDSTPASGGLYIWDGGGAAWVKVATIL